MARRALDPKSEQPKSTRSKENTRARLMATARKLFYSLDYTAISVDLIAREAGFTRAAFYLHFGSKDDLLAAMMIAESRLTDPLFRWFEREPPSPDSIERFIRAFLASAHASPAIRLFNVAALQSDLAKAAIHQNRWRLMAVMGESFPAFRPPPGDSPEELRQIARTNLALVQLEQIGLHEEDLAGPALAEAMIATMRDLFLALLHDYPAVSDERA